MGTKFKYMMPIVLQEGIMMTMKQQQIRTRKTLREHETNPNDDTSTSKGENNEKNENNEEVEQYQNNNEELYVSGQE